MGKMRINFFFFFFNMFFPRKRKPIFIRNECKTRRDGCGESSGDIVNLSLDKIIGLEYYCTYVANAVLAIFFFLLSAITSYISCIPDFFINFIPSR